MIIRQRIKPIIVSQPAIQFSATTQHRVIEPVRTPLQLNFPSIRVCVSHQYAVHVATTPYQAHCDLTRT
ncbi:hypothetical protein RSSM_01900 [Rhodopirellula sallentina SM41]|uniref:Uncharacterized protein n=1 Tax=Rhodopirellula sallentina SM41 TaxID=1263870 RepID=M5UFL3_9BACT|nr:hypothetical protein RSSM_01900 [Rhodopirellula sallentina SM41]